MSYSLLYAGLVFSNLLLIITQRLKNKSKRENLVLDNTREYDRVPSTN